MLVLKISLVIAILLAIVFGITSFNEHCRGRFGHAFFTKSAFSKTVSAFGLILIGSMWRASAAHDHGDTLNGLLLMGAGAGIILWLIYTNFKRTNVIYGIGGSALQIAVFTALAWIGIPILLAVLFIEFLVIATARPVYVVNR